MVYKGEKVMFDGKKIVLREEEIKDVNDDEIILKAEWTQISWNRSCINKDGSSRKKRNRTWIFFCWDNR
ncbi:MAG: hypothetical protein N2589_02820 [bacterium]|nr:hypothetical protein [bacterium]